VPEEAKGSAELEPSAAGFNLDPTGRTDGLEDFPNIENGQFSLATGRGFVSASTQFNKSATLQICYVASLQATVLFGKKGGCSKPAHR